MGSVNRKKWLFDAFFWSEMEKNWSEAHSLFNFYKAPQSAGDFLLSADDLSSSVADFLPSEGHLQHSVNDLPSSEGDLQHSVNDLQPSEGDLPSSEGWPPVISGHPGKGVHSRMESNGLIRGWVNWVNWLIGLNRFCVNQ